MKMLQYVIISALLLATITPTKAQQGSFGWRIGAGMGYTNYYGDVSSYHLYGFKDWKKGLNIMHTDLENIKSINDNSFALFLERKLTPTIGLMATVSQQEFTANDRKNHKGEVDPTALNFGRALNFKTKLNDVALAFVFKTDNDKFLGSNALIAPYFALGGGLTRFNVKGDLYNADGKRYYYYNKDNTIHTTAQTDPIASPAIEQDGEFETDLTALNTELGNAYSTTVPFATLGLGIKLKLTRRFNLNLQTDFRYAFTDYMDDVSADYKSSYPNEQSAYAANPSGISRVNRGDNDGVNDIYQMTTLSIRYNFGRKKYSFKTPVLYAQAPASAPKTTTINAVPSAPSSNTTNNTTIIKETHTTSAPQGNQPIIINNPAYKNQTSRKDTMVNININYNYGYDNYGPVPAQQPTIINNSIPSNNNQDDVNRLKMELERLRLEMQKNQNNQYIPKSNDVIVVPQSNNSTPVIIDNSKQVADLQKQLAEMSAQISALKNQPAPVPANNNPIVINTTNTYREEIKNIPPASVYFSTGSSVVTAQEKEKLFQVINIYKKYPTEAKISIKGFTDAQGNPDKNMQLSQKRSNEVRDILVNQYGINPNDIVVNYFGQQNAISSTSGNPYGRRVDVEFVK